MTKRQKKSRPRPVSMRATFIGMAAILRASARDIEKRFGIPRRP